MAEQKNPPAEPGTVTMSASPTKVKNLLKKTKISLWLDEYDNIFSDFDPRSFSQRSLSDDFLNEAKKVVYEGKPGVFDLTFLVPLNKRNHATENIIKSKLHSHFKKKLAHLQKEHTNYIKKGILLIILGAIFMFVATIVAGWENNFIFNFLRVVLEPSGWFMSWYGLDHIFYLSKENRQELEFNKKMAHAEINFDSY